LITLNYNKSLLLDEFRFRHAEQILFRIQHQSSRVGSDV